MRTLAFAFALLFTACSFPSGGRERPAATPVAPPRPAATPVAPPPELSMSTEELNQHAGQVVTVVGKAENSKLAAEILNERSCFSVDGLSSWPDDLHGELVEVTGRLTLHDFGDPPSMTHESRLSARAYGKHWYLEDATWKKATNIEVRGIKGPQASGKNSGGKNTAR